MSTNDTKKEKHKRRPAPDFTQCEHWGKGGSFTYDPASQTRTPAVAPDAEPAPEAQQDPAAAGGGRKPSKPGTAAVAEKEQQHG